MQNIHKKYTNMHVKYVKYVSNIWGVLGFSSQMVRVICKTFKTLLHKTSSILLLQYT